MTSDFIVNALATLPSSLPPLTVDGRHIPPRDWRGVLGGLPLLRVPPDVFGRPVFPTTAERRCQVLHHMVVEGQTPAPTVYLVRTETNAGKKPAASSRPDDCTVVLVDTSGVLVDENGLFCEISEVVLFSPGLRCCGCLQFAVWRRYMRNQTLPAPPHNVCITLTNPFGGGAPIQCTRTAGGGEDELQHNFYTDVFLLLRYNRRGKFLNHDPGQTANAPIPLKNDTIDGVNEDFFPEHVQCRRSVSRRGQSARL